MTEFLTRILPLATSGPGIPGAAPGGPAVPGGSGAPGAGQQYMMFIMIGIFFVVFYFITIRPQRKQQKDRQAMLDSLKVGDKILTTGGIYGQITNMGKTAIRVRVAQGVEMRMNRAAIASKTSKDEKEEE